MKNWKSITEFDEKVKQMIESAKNYEPKMAFRWLVEFPDEFHIPSFTIQKCQLPIYSNGAWQKIKIQLTDPICPSSAVGLMKMIKHCETMSYPDILFTYYIHTLDPTARRVETWEIDVEDIEIQLADLDYSADGIQLHTIIIQPHDVKLIDE